jgi:hypothetical protein
MRHEMSKNNHPVEQEELMAYLDGELATDRAVEAAAHLEHCAECQEFAAELRTISAELMVWEAESPDIAEMPNEIVAALEEKNREPKTKVRVREGWRGLFTARRLVLGGGGALCFLLVLAISLPKFLLPHAPQQPASEMVQLVPYTQPPTSSIDKSLDGEAFIAPGIVGGNVSSASKQKMERTRQASDVTESENDNLTADEASSAIPMIARTADLTLNTKEFDKVRASMEEILKRHNGYMGELTVTAPNGAGRTLTSTLRIPAPQLDVAVVELKQLGRVEKEAQGGEEVTQQYVDLEARMANSQHTEQRLTQILQQRTGKLQDVLKVELEIDRVRGEIEQMQAEKKELSKRVAFATLNMTVQEEYQAKLQSAPPSTASQFRNAAVDGYNTVVETLISIGLFLLSAGPSLLVWIAILFFPARWAWKKWKKESLRRKHEETEADAK